MSDAAPDAPSATPPPSEVGPQDAPADAHDAARRLLRDVAAFEVDPPAPPRATPDGP